MVGGGLLAASIVALLDRRRRNQRRRGATAEPVDEQQLWTEIALRRGADTKGATRLDLALRALVTGLHRQGGDDIAVLAVRVDGDSIEVLLDAPAGSPPEGFYTTGDPRGWRLHDHMTDADLIRLGDGATSPFPALVTIGTADGDPVLIDVETAGIVTITGPDDTTGPYLRRIAAEFATSGWADHLDIITIGEPIAHLPGTNRARHFDTFDDARRHLQGIATATAAELESAGHPTTTAARLADEHGDGWIPTILISTNPLPDEALRSLAELIEPRRGIGVIAPGAPITNGWNAVLDADGHIEVAPHGLSLAAPALAAERAATINQILADSEAGPEPDEDESDEWHGDPMPEADEIPDPGPYVDPPYDIEFRVLGAIDVVGIPPIERRKSMEIAVYLALHPEGVTDDRLKMVFWPDAVPAQNTFNTTISMTRSALGTDADGNLYLPHFASSNQRYRLTDKVTTDLARLEARINYARTAPPERAQQALDEAKTLIRGQPFDVSRNYEWAFAEGHVIRCDDLSKFGSPPFTQ